MPAEGCPLGTGEVWDAQIPDQCRRCLSLSFTMAHAFTEQVCTLEEVAAACPDQEVEAMDGDTSVMIERIGNTARRATLEIVSKDPAGSGDHADYIELERTRSSITCLTEIELRNSR